MEAKAPTQIPETMLEAVRYFADPQVAQDFFVSVRWPHGVACPRMGCGSAEVAYLAKVRRWYCNECKRQFSAKVGTIFEDSPIGLDKWLPALWLLASNKNGISSHELARALGVTQKTAWFMLHRIRHSMKDDSTEILTGDVEADETYIGGKVKHNKKLRAYTRATGEQFIGKYAGDKTPIFGVMQRGGRAKAWVVPDTKHKTLLPKLYESVHHGATLHTDSASIYKVTGEEYFNIHQVVNHAIEYVRGNAHINNMECFWSVLKRTLGGTYIHAHPRHLERYLDEQLFRFNERENDDGPRFAKAAKGADGKRLTYKTLTAKR